MKRIKYKNIKDKDLLETLEAFKNTGVKITDETIITIKKVKGTHFEEFDFEQPNIGGIYSF